ncbi:MAG: hypothetical protein WCC64_19100 [Aliidongia sp.]|jgi:hypothetical protein
MSTITPISTTGLSNTIVAPPTPSSTGNGPDTIRAPLQPIGGNATVAPPADAPAPPVPPLHSAGTTGTNVSTVA